MPVLSDADITELLCEQKVLPDDIRQIMKPKIKLGHSEWEYRSIGEKGSQFQLILRANKLNPLDFSVILAYQVPNTTNVFRLCRYNGKSHEHTNKIEQHTFYDYHIHRATERYQHLCGIEDMYAEPTNRYSDYYTALSCLLNDCGFIIPQDVQPSLL